MPIAPKPLSERFPRHYRAVTGGCWEWTAHRTNTGYGVIASDTFPKRPLLAHRVSYELHVGLIPAGMFVCHTCDNRGCCNPEHLFVGTNSDNMKDMVRKGRRVANPPRGEAHDRATLTNEQVKQIRERFGHRPRGYAAVVAGEFGVSRDVAWQVVGRKSWKHL